MAASNPAAWPLVSGPYAHTDDPEAGQPAGRRASGARARPRPRARRRSATLALALGLVLLLGMGLVIVRHGAPATGAPGTTAPAATGGRPEACPARGRVRLSPADLPLHPHCPISGLAAGGPATCPVDLLQRWAPASVTWAGTPAAPFLHLFVGFISADALSAELLEHLLAFQTAARTGALAAELDSVPRSAGLEQRFLLGLAILPGTGDADQGPSVRAFRGQLSRAGVPTVLLPASGTGAPEAHIAQAAGRLVAEAIRPDFYWLLDYDQLTGATSSPAGRRLPAPGDLVRGEVAPLAGGLFQPFGLRPATDGAWLDDLFAARAPGAVAVPPGPGACSPGAPHSPWLAHPDPGRLAAGLAASPAASPADAATEPGHLGSASPSADGDRLHLPPLPPVLIPFPTPVGLLAGDGTSSSGPEGACRASPGPADHSHPTTSATGPGPGPHRLWDRLLPSRTADPPVGAGLPTILRHTPPKADPGPLLAPARAAQPERQRHWPSSQCVLDTVAAAGPGGDGRQGGPLGGASWRVLSSNLQLRAPHADLAGGRLVATGPWLTPATGGAGPAALSAQLANRVLPAEHPLRSTLWEPVLGLSWRAVAVLDAALRADAAYQVAGVGPPISAMPGHQARILEQLTLLPSLLHYCGLISHFAGR
ncbi:hypothetical protein H696_01426 [Fonticula alba]|uniref:Uncharacterized protein n=1 Tax=Fonticula alba TaxID=691883 RepID=A0A058ZCB3_FONAL|nr:hypothetical protein H696_01426 [Fonticula alba]KCV72019.1 hypothetical protein H696_01426 [Fonticula alba]|eukprot:XP_009493597.1 hypothetical protein H696_01426 [Fonticula alba]